MDNIIEILRLLFTKENVKVFLCSYAAEKALDVAGNKALNIGKSFLGRSSSELHDDADDDFDDDCELELTLLHVLDKSLMNVCNHYHWEYDEEAIVETLLISWEEINDFPNTREPKISCNRYLKRLLANV